MPKKDFSQVAFDVVQQATGEKPKAEPKTKKEASPKEKKGVDASGKTKANTKR